MLLVQQSNGGSEVELAGHHRHATAHAVERISIAHQDTQRSLRSRSWNLDKNLPDYPFTTIGGEHGFHGDLIARPSFRQIRPRALQASLATLLHEIALHLYRRNCGNIERIVIDASESVAQGKSRQKCRRLAGI